MTPSGLRWSETWRVLAYTAVIALAFVVLGHVESALFDWFGAGNSLAAALDRSKSADAALAREAEQVALQSRSALARVPGQRLAAFRIGYDLGYASSFIGSYAMSSAQILEVARQVGDRHVALARELGAPLGIDGIAELPVHTLQEFVALTQRFERDENGLAARIERELSPAHRELYLLGLQLGGEASTVESSGGKLTQPPVTQIRRHATLAGIEPALWQPLATQPRGESPEQVLARYRAGLTALGADLAANDEAGTTMTR